jgi:signal recognition particle subunit SRP54
MFDQLTERFETVLRNLRGVGKITDSNIQQTVREVRRVLLEADVNLDVIQRFLSQVKQRAEGTKTVKSIKPGELFIQIIRDEMIKLLGKDTAPLGYSDRKPSVILMVGLQGSGKTTTCVKLAQRIKKEGRSVMLVAGDIYRPAAREQLKVLGDQIGIHVHIESTKNPIKICKHALSYAKEKRLDTVIIDTAGRLHVDEKLMDEIATIQRTVNPYETLYIADGMTGQDAVNSASDFAKQVDLTGIILTKMDGDAKGGAAVSIVDATKTPIKFIGTSEKLDGIESFDPERIVDRILGFGDIISLVEKAQTVADEKVLKRTEERIKSAQFSLEDFRDQLQQLQKMGSMNQMMAMIPGIDRKTLKGMKFDERQMKWMEAIINSMTGWEREHPQMLNGSRRKRISEGSGRPVQEINQLIKQFTAMQRMMKKVNKGKIPGLPPGMKLPGNFPGLN